MNLITQLEDEISGLLGSIKVKTSNIKETLKKQKNILTSDEEIAAIAIEDINIDVLSDIQSDIGAPNDNTAILNQSINSEVRVDDDAVSSHLNESLASVIQVIQTPEKF